MNISEIMTLEVIAVSKDTPLEQAVRLMMAHRISGLPVVSQANEVIGVLTEGDLLRRAENETAGKPPGWLVRFLWPSREARQYVLTHGRKVSQVMSEGVVSVAPEASLSEAVDLICRHRIKRLPVVSAGKLVGIVSRANIIASLAASLPTAAVSLDDAEIRRALLVAMENEPWAPRKLIEMSVDNGVVSLDGTVFSAEEREGMTVLAENIPGVRQVDNRIVCIEPYTGVVTYDPWVQGGSSVSL